MFGDAFEFHFSTFSEMQVWLTWCTKRFLTLADGSGLALAYFSDVHWLIMAMHAGSSGTGSVSSLACLSTLHASSFESFAR